MAKKGKPLILDIKKRLGFEAEATIEEMEQKDLEKVNTFLQELAEAYKKGKVTTNQIREAVGLSSKKGLDDYVTIIEQNNRKEQD